MENEKRLIDANRLKDVIQEVIEETEPSLYTKVLIQMGYVLDACPTVDAVEVVHGHWCWEGRFKACSECGSYVEWDETLGANFWKFCPYCGAKMDGGEVDG